jgi:hypothetical protein
MTHATNGGPTAWAIYFSRAASMHEADGDMWDFIRWFLLSLSL